jgi:hypothetical protein
MQQWTNIGGRGYNLHIIIIIIQYNKHNNPAGCVLACNIFNPKRIFFKRKSNNFKSIPLLYIIWEKDDKHFLFFQKKNCTFSLKGLEKKREENR